MLRPSPANPSLRTAAGRKSQRCRRVAAGGPNVLPHPIAQRTSSIGQLAQGRQESASGPVAHQDRPDRAWHGHWTRSVFMSLHKQDASLSRRAALAGLGAGGLGLAVAATARPLARPGRHARCAGRHGGARRRLRRGRRPGPAPRRHQAGRARRAAARRPPVPRRRLDVRDQRPHGHGAAGRRPGGGRLRRLQRRVPL